MDITPPDRQKRFFLIWAITASVAALVFANLALVLFLRLRSAPEEAPVAAVQTDSLTTPQPPRPAWAPSPGRNDGVEYGRIEKVTE